MPILSPLPHICDNAISVPTAALELDEKKQSAPSVDSQKQMLEEKRDAGVSDEIWQHLQQDKAAALAHEQKLLELRNAHYKKKERKKKTGCSRIVRPKGRSTDQS